MKTGLYSDMKKLLSVTFPILVAQLSTMGINFINTTMAGHAGADDLAGVSVGTGIFFPFEGAAIGLLMAGTPIIAQLIGKNEKSSIPFVVRTGIYIALALSMLFFAGYFFFADEVVSSMGLTAEVEYIAKNYIFAMVVAMVFISLIIDRCGRKHGYLYETFSFRASYQCCFELFSDLWSWRAASPWRYRCRRFGGNYVLFRTADVPLCDS